MTFAACSFLEYDSAMGGAPVRISNGYPRYRLAYSLPGAVKWPLLFPDRHAIKWPEAEGAPLYVQKIERNGAEAIRADAQEPRSQPGIDENQRLVLFCFEQLAKNPGLHCHRTLFSVWRAERTGEDIPEFGGASSQSVARKPKNP